VIPETDQKYPILWTQDVVQKDLQVALMSLGELILAATEVYDQPESKGNFHTVGKEGNLLRHCVLEDFDFVFGKVLDENATRIASRECYVHESDVNSDRFLTRTDGDKEAKEPGRDENAGFGTWPEFGEPVMPDTHIDAIRWILHDSSPD